MALIAASINITFNANYAGCHRVCWRTGGAGPYDCTIQVNCTGSGNSCAATIPIMVNNQSCNPVTFDGYVQACCEDINSQEGKLPFSVTFTPNPNCKGYTISCVGPVGVNTISITNPGSGYVPGATIPITITGGGGSGASIDALIGDGGILTESIFNAGSLYVDGVYANVPAVTLTGTGSGALFTVTVSGGVVTAVAIVPGSNGTGYNIGDTISFNAANLGGSGSGVVVTINTLNTGQVQSITVNSNGSGYTSQATGTFPPSGGGITATGVILMTPCPTIDVDTCGATPIATIPGIPLGSSFVACNTTPYSLPVEYTVNQDSCCFECTTLTFDKGATPFSTVYYEDCTTKQIISTVLAPNSSLGPVCAVANSWLVIESNPVTGSTSITVGASCP